MTARVRTIEFHVANADMSVIRRHQWEADYAIGEATVTIQEWCWYPGDEQYHSQRRTYTLDVTPGGYVDGTVQPLGAYARERVLVLTRKCRLKQPTICCTDLDIEHEPIPTDGGGHSTLSGP